MILKPELFGLSKEDGTIGARVSFLLTGIWWFGFAQGIDPAGHATEQ
ncbi:MAG: hypothetical protein QM781_10315 [Chitinophagaceae bacterium]